MIVARDFVHAALLASSLYGARFCIRLAHSKRTSPDIQFLITHSLSLTFAMVALVYVIEPNHFFGMRLVVSGRSRSASHG